jgi:hypothetical protein
VSLSLQAPSCTRLYLVVWRNWTDADKGIVS